MKYFTQSIFSSPIPQVQKYQNLREVSCKNMYEIKKIYNIKNIVIQH